MTSEHWRGLAGTFSQRILRRLETKAACSEGSKRELARQLRCMQHYKTAAAGFKNFVTVQHPVS
jgi:hypothetical protein